MTLSFNKLNEIAALYESIADSEQEQLNEGPYSADSVRAAQEAAKKGELERSNKEKVTNTALQASKGKEAKQAPAGSSPKELQQASIQGILDRQKDRGGNNNGWNKDNLTKTINPKYTPQNIAKAQQAVGIKPAISTKDPKPDPNPERQTDTRTSITAKPASAKVLPSKPAGSAMDQWAKANPKLAAAAAEKARIRGTNQTDNPLMKDMRSSLPAPTSSQSPAVAKLGAGNQSLTNNPNVPKPSTLAAATTAASKPETSSLGQRAAAMPAMGSSQFKPATTSQATNAAGSNSAAASGSVVPQNDKLAASKKPVDIKASYEYDAYDLVLEYLLSQGHAETVAEAQYIMTEMDAEMIGDIVEEVLEEGDNYDKNRKRAAQRAAARNEARAKGQTGNVPGVGYVTPRRESETYRDSAGTERHKTGARMPEKKG